LILQAVATLGARSLFGPAPWNQIANGHAKHNVAVPPQQKQLTVSELVRLTAAFAISCLIYLGSSATAYFYLPEGSSLAIYLAYLALVLFLPALLAVALACLIPTWRSTAAGVR
jgi:hypothetical protein